ncbi:MAG: ComEA family DNA-binding protein [bacterium]
MNLTKQEKLATSILILTLGVGLIGRVVYKSEVILQGDTLDAKEESIVSIDSIASEKSDFIPMDLNRAGLDEIVLLPGIGPKKAQAIVDWRNQKGCFSSVDDLLRVKGIGPKTLELIRPFVTVSDTNCLKND